MNQPYLARSPVAGTSDPSGSETGSILLALLATLVIGGVVSALFVTVLSSQKNVRRDTSYQDAVQVADAGIQQALTVLAELPPGATPDPSLMSGTLAGGAFSWTATSTGFATWDVRAQGTSGEVTRVLEGSVGRQALFPLAAFSDEQLTVNGGGGGGAVSYDEFGTCNSSTTDCDGNVGSNTGVDINGSWYLDNIELYKGAVPGGTGVLNGEVRNLNYNPPLPNLAQAAFDTGGACDGRPITTYTGSTDLVRGEIYCFNDVTFPRGNTNLVNNSDPAKNTEPVIIYVSAAGDVTLTGSGGGNPPANTCDGGSNACVNLDALPIPNSMDLLIFMAGGRFDTGNNHNQIAAGIWAPESSCTGSAKFRMYGSLVCNDLTGRGGWEFNYDERLAEVFGDDFALESLREEVGGTSFTP